ncbi:YqaJ viral recombinase family protein [Geomonas nitrogeniifigens]|uniref:YqaJ viral recombinase family protein n=1 Tax=Geomonas diazotrophica TaxID=2843197 RepID=UPI001C2C969F|nr:YqaJ viral recombinase family protein [Geomonas nitrogeniifigens]QXE86002.1 YqaJ viral recombinase family protein [Geomonas nitrogeniifigens]
MTIKYHSDIIQGSDEWLALRRGILTASEMKLIITSALKVADNDKTRAHVYEIAAQRITGHVEPCYISDDMMRGFDDEIRARNLYNDRFAPVKEMGFITNDKWGFTIGYSPDGLVGDDGAIECKSRRQKFQIQTIVENVPADTIPADYVIQHQTGLLVSEREWIDFISYSGGLEMVTVRVYPDPKIQEAIIAAATAFEKKVQEVIDAYRDITSKSEWLIPTERHIEQEIML